MPATAVARTNTLGRMPAQRNRDGAQTVLVVDDEEIVRDVVIRYLERDGFRTMQAADGASARDLIEANEHSLALVVLDLMLPEITGLELCSWIRSRGDLPVIMLTARSEETDRIVGLELGADDYMAKPFSPRELVARVRARLRRATTPAAERGSWRQSGDFAHDSAGQRIRYGAQELSLTRYEYRLLAALLARPGAIMSREQLMADVWRDAPETFDRTVDTHIKTLRTKLHAIDPGRDPIQTHRGMGYSLKV